MKSIYIVIVAQTNDAQPVLKVLKGADDPKTPLIVLANPSSNIHTEVMSEPEIQNPDLETTIATPTDTTTSKTEKPSKKIRPPQIKNPSFNQQQRQKLGLQELLSMPGGWESIPISNPVSLVAMSQQAHIQPIFYPMPVYIPYPINPLMLSHQMNTVGPLENKNLEDQINFRFNELMSAKLLRDAFKGDNPKWPEMNNNFVRPGNQKWRGKFRKTTSTTTTTTTDSPVTQSTEPTRISVENNKETVAEQQK
ncbi:uncharacterized protein [Drosophila bipectinata]|uniref:uncharacterized protein n=1 Tax=Drosophila bipectinata TaxID=42026 RepID=UPI0038B2C20E